MIAVGDVVLVHDGCKKIYWKLAIIESLVYGKDNLVKAVNIHTANGITNRAITKLYPLEKMLNFVTRKRTPMTVMSVILEEPENSVDRPQRDFARRARISDKTVV